MGTSERVERKERKGRKESKSWIKPSKLQEANCRCKRGEKEGEEEEIRGMRLCFGGK
jgi:hypothetical protein